MSVRTSYATQAAADATAIRTNLEALKQQAQAQNRRDSVEASLATAEVSQSFESLAPHEQAAASLGVHPDSYKPIGFLNNAHFNTLLKENALDDDLARRIEAFRTVASEGQE